MLQLCAYLDLMLKFFPRDTCLMDLLLPMESTSVTMSGSKPVRHGRNSPGCSKQFTEVAPRWSLVGDLQSHQDPHMGLSLLHRAYLLGRQQIEAYFEKGWMEIVDSRASFWSIGGVNRFLKDSKP